MTLRLFNTLTKTKDVFAPLDPKNVRMYVCGPTVYDFAHIGNARPAIVFDVLYRLLKHLAACGEWDEGKGETQVTYVRNITDVDDKINERALRDFPGLPLNDAIRHVTEKTERQYHIDVGALGCLPPTFEPRATDFVLPRPDGKIDMITLIGQLIARSHAYEAGGEVLFDIQSMPDYGRLSGRRLDEQQAGARVAVDAHKKHPHDFVLWKLSADNEPGWDSPWGRGRPGWHIECSAMSAAYLGNMFDIHGGGLDLIFPHHENEIAQSRCAHGTPLMANVWMHNGFLQVEGEKMSKSLGNFVIIRELLRGWCGEAWSGGALRLTMLKTHYRQPINWTFEELVKSKYELARFVSAIRLGGTIDFEMTPTKDFIDALSDDLNMPEALKIVRAQCSLAFEGKTEFSHKLAANLCFLGLLKQDLLGAYSQELTADSVSIPDLLKNESLLLSLKVALVNDDKNFQHELLKELAELNLKVVIKGGDLSVSYADGAVVDNAEIITAIAARNAARKNKDFKESDRIRDDLLAKGIVLKDGPGGTTWEVKR
jgi:cysteinyl-tRNA synthetase